MLAKPAIIQHTKELIAKRSESATSGRGRAWCRMNGRSPNTPEGLCRC
jgi:hypothetical protein